MPRSISQGPVKYDQKDELSRAGRKIAALKKHIRFLEEVLEERTRPSSYVRALSEGDDHDKASVGVHLDKITEWKENFGLLHKAYQDSVEESKQRAQEVRKLEEVVRKKDEKIAALERALSCKTKKTKHQKTELKNLQQSLTSAKAEIETHRQYANSVQECNAEKVYLFV
jgi:peptidoglycan hydrolase CwlO-like protein